MGKKNIVYSSQDFEPLSLFIVWMFPTFSFVRMLCDVFAQINVYISFTHSDEAVVSTWSLSLIQDFFFLFCLSDVLTLLLWALTHAHAFAHTQRTFHMFPHTHAHNKHIHGYNICFWHTFYQFAFGCREIWIKEKRGVRRESEKWEGGIKRKPESGRGELRKNQRSGREESEENERSGREESRENQWGGRRIRRESEEWKKGIRRDWEEWEREEEKEISRACGRA